MSRPLMTDIEIAVLEDLKRFPERIIEVRTKIITVCARCLTPFPTLMREAKQSYVIASWDHYQTAIQETTHKNCSACGLSKFVEIFDSNNCVYVPGGTLIIESELKRRCEAHIRISPPAFHIVKITEYVVERYMKKIGLFRKEMVEKTIEERQYID